MLLGPAYPRRLDASPILDRLYQGGAPEAGRGVSNAGFDVLVLTAIEYQPPKESFPGVEVIRVPLNDMQPTRGEVADADAAAKLVARRLREGKRVLTTCYAGLNRSGWVNALALRHLGMPADRAVQLVRRRRSPRALNNPYFVADVLKRTR